MITSAHNVVQKLASRHELVAVVLCVATVTAGNRAEATIYNVTPHDAGGGVEVAGGTFTTDGTEGPAVSLGSILTDYAVEVTNGSGFFTMTPANSDLLTNAFMEVTATTITFPDTPDSRTFRIADASVNNRYQWVDRVGTTPSTLAIHAVDASFGVIVPAPQFTGNVATVVPEPTTFSILVGVAGLASLASRRRKRFGMP